MAKILKNTTALDITIKATGDTIAALSTLTVDPTSYVYYATVDTIAELTAPINSGDIIVNDGLVDLTPPSGLRFLEYPDRIIVKQGSVIVDVLKEIRVSGSATLTQPVGTEGVIDINVGAASGNTVVGALHQLAFSGIGNNKNKWLKLYGDNKKSSNESPGVMVWKSKLAGLSFSNEKKSVESDIEIHVSSQVDGSSPTTVVYTWAVRDARVCRRTNFSPDIIFDAGDKVAIYMKDAGTDPKSPTVVMYFQALEDNSEEFCETYSGDFKSNGAGTGTS